MEGLNNKKVNKGWFKIWNVFFDEYTPELGYTTSIVYLCMRRHMNNKTRIAFPSEEVIADKLSMSRRTVVRTIKLLEKYKIIIKTKVKDKGKWPHNEYYFTYTRDWLIQPCDFKSPSKASTHIYSQNDKKDKNYVTQSHLNNTNNKKTEELRLKADINDNSP